MQTNGSQKKQTKKFDAIRVPPGYRTLSTKEAKAALSVHGENIIFHTRHDRPIIAFIKKFNSPLLILLTIASIISIGLGQYVSGGVIAFMVLLSALLDFFNSYRSEQVAESLASKIVTTSQVIRDGVSKEIPLRQIVPQDIIILRPGSVIPADGVLIEGDDVFANQAPLTGESFPVEKVPYRGNQKGISITVLRPDVSYALFMGTSIVTGFGLMLVLKTGKHAEFGRIAERLAQEDTDTAFDRGIRSFSFFIMRIAFFMVSAIFLLHAFKGGISILDSLLFAMAIAVGLTPELLPVVMTVTLSRGSLRMAKKHVVVRHLAAIQNFGAMTILATDKTGTLTEDKITLVRCTDPWGEESERVFESAYISSVFSTTRTSPLDDAIRQHHTKDTSKYKKIDEIPFDFMRKRGSIVYDHGTSRALVTKGAPEELVQACVSVDDVHGKRHLDDAAKQAALNMYQQLSSEGFRVLAVAERHVPQDGTKNYPRESEHELALLGFAAFYDPPKQTAAHALQELADRSITVKIITGDSEQLTERICKEIGLPVQGVLTGREISEMNDSKLALAAKGATIFARVTPEEKERVVKALRASGETVGYLGDGINDAPALKAADVGISVNNAVDVAKETADIILLQKSLDVLAEGVLEGRKTFENTMKYIRMAFSSNFGNMASMMAASVFLPFLPMLPGQILINNFLYDLSQTALPTDRVDASAVRRPVTWNMGAIRRYMTVFGLVSSVFDILTFVILYKLFGLTNGAFQTGWFIESIATQVLVVHVIRTQNVPFIQSRPSKTLFISSLFIITLAVAIPYLPYMSHIGFVSLPLPILFAIAGITIIYLFVAEGAKRLYYAIEERRGKVAV